MLIFTLAISCLITSNLPWFMDLTFQVPIQYCSLQHQTLLLSPVTSTTGAGFALVHLFILSGVISPSISSSILGTYPPGSSSFSVLSFGLFMLFMGFSRQEYWSGLPFPSPVDHVLSELWAMTTGFTGGSDSKASACIVGDTGLIPAWGRSPGEGNGNPL